MRIAVVVACLALSMHWRAPQAAVVDHGRASASSSQTASLAGTWRLVGTHQRMADGTVRPDPDLGSKPAGYLMFDANAGQMCVVINNGDRAKWQDAAHPTDAEVRSIWQQTVSYCGTWTVDSSGRELAYRLEANMSPNLIGAERRRRFTLDGDRLILYPTPLPAGVVEWTVEWRKASAR